MCQFKGDTTVAGHSPLRFFVLTAGAVFLAEAGVMVLLEMLPKWMIPAAPVLDAGLLVAIISPMLYLWLYRPLLNEMVARRRTEQELLVTVSRLQEALANVKTLKGLLPICAWCKKVRDDKGYWSQLEHYVAENSDADFTHGICPECAENIQQDLP